MELKFVSNVRTMNLSKPFPNNFMRTSGSGRISRQKIDGEGETLCITQHDIDNGKDVITNFVDKVMSEIKDGQFVNFIELRNPETGVGETTVWDENEWSAYIVNDNGKTIDKL